MIRYRLEITPDDNGTWLVRSSDLPGLTTFGETREEALARAKDAAETLIDFWMARGMDVPPSANAAETGESLILPLQDEFKIKLYGALRAANMNRADLQKLLGWKRESVDRLFRLDHASRLDQIEAAYAALGYRASVALEACA